MIDIDIKSIVISIELYFDAEIKIKLSLIPIFFLFFFFLMEHLLHASPNAKHWEHRGRPGDGGQLIFLTTDLFPQRSVIYWCSAESLQSLSTYKVCTYEERSDGLGSGEKCMASILN